MKALNLRSPHRYSTRDSVTSVVRTQFRNQLARTATGSSNASGVRRCPPAHSTPIYVIALQVLHRQRRSVPTTWPLCERSVEAYSVALGPPEPVLFRRNVTAIVPTCYIGF